MKNEFREKDLELYLARHMSVLTAAICGNSDLSLCLLGTQVQCGTGIIDMLAFTGLQVFVIELKAGTATERTVGQVYRYASAVEYKLEQMVVDSMFDIFGMNEIWNVPQPQLVISPVVIAPDFSRDAIRCLSHYGFPLIAQENKDHTFSLYIPESENFSHINETAIRNALAGYSPESHVPCTYHRQIPINDRQATW